MHDMTERHGALLDPLSVQLAAEILDDLEKVRMANGARYGALTGFTPAGQPWKPDKDEQVRTAGMSPDHPDAVRFLSIYDALGKVEADAVKGLEKAMGAHPLGPWVKAQRGLGFKQAGRLLAAIGDPYWRPEIVKTDEDGAEVSRTPAGPRTVSALWAYSGEHVIDGAAARRKKGVKSNWSTNAKTRAWLCAESCVKQLVKPCTATDGHVNGECRCSPFRVKYDTRKAYTQANRLEWTDGHRHVDAMRVTAKEILKELWREARRLHLELDPDLIENLPEPFGT
jgi:hypothetical protein